VNDPTQQMVYVVMNDEKEEDEVGERERDVVYV
jgi:hypothetical protein